MTSQTASSPSRSLAVYGGIVTVTSPLVDLAGASALRVSAWIRRGSDSFSEDPDSGEDFYVEYLRSDDVWVTLGTYRGNGTPGQIYTPSFSLPAAAAHAGFRLRLRMRGYDRPPWDYWHVDSLCLEGSAAQAGSAAAEWRFEEAAWIHPTSLEKKGTVMGKETDNGSQRAQMSIVAIRRGWSARS